MSWEIKEFKFTDINELEEYFSGDKIVCLRCGKAFRTLGMHLRFTHNMSADEYRDIYGIPWTKGLSCAATTKLHSDQNKHLRETGILVTDPKQVELAFKGKRNERKRPPIRAEYSKIGLSKANKGKTGEESERRRNLPKFGSEDHRLKMRSIAATNNRDPITGKFKKIKDSLGGRNDIMKSIMETKL